MNFSKAALLISLSLGVALTGCAVVPTVSQSQAYAWQKYGNKSVDNLLLGWGPAMKETRRLDGARILSYSYSNTYDFGTKDQKSYNCVATAIAPPPDFKISDISMMGQDFECATIANGYSGQTGIQPAHPNSYLRDHPPAFPF